MEKEYDSVVYMDLRGMITKRGQYDSDILEASRKYLDKLGFDAEDDCLINTTSFEVSTLVYLILDILTEYKTLVKQAEDGLSKGAINQSAV